jgi:glycosyltransferase involved in cell wall biosynthesis
VQKRPEALVTLLYRLHAGFPNLYLLLAGSGPLERAVRHLAVALGVERYVIFAGFQERVEELIPALDLHLLLSQREGFGIATIEAMACGVPAVASNVPGNTDVLTGSEGGVLVPLEDEEAVARTVAALLSPSGLLRGALHGTGHRDGRHDGHRAPADPCGNRGVFHRRRAGRSGPGPA